MNHRMTAPPFGPVTPTGAGVIASSDSDGLAAALGAALAAVDAAAAAGLGAAVDADGAGPPHAAATSSTTPASGAMRLGPVRPRCMSVLLLRRSVVRPSSRSLPKMDRRDARRRSPAGLRAQASRRSMHAGRARWRERLAAPPGRGD